jgi:hypothetical protein
MVGPAIAGLVRARGKRAFSALHDVAHKKDKNTEGSVCVAPNSRRQLLLLLLLLLLLHDSRPFHRRAGCIVPGRNFMLANIKLPQRLKQPHTH